MEKLTDFALKSEIFKKALNSNIESMSSNNLSIGDLSKPTAYTHFPVQLEKSKICHQHLRDHDYFVQAMDRKKLLKGTRA